MENIVNENKRRKLDRPITGIIQEDRIWEQWYDQDIFKKELPKMTQKDYLFQCIGDEPGRVVLNNRNQKEFTVAQLKKYIEKFEKAFLALNLSKGDVICTIGLNTPELYAIKYASTNVGLITCNLNILDLAVKDGDKNRLYSQIDSVKPKVIFTLDYLEDKMYSVINDEKFADILKVSMPLVYSTSKLNPERLLLALKAYKDFQAGKNITSKIKLDEFLSYGENITDDELHSVYSEKQACNISFTSGTTGINKAVLLSHDANNALAFQQINGQFGFIKGTNHLALIPPFLAFWDADITHAALCLGNKNILDLKLDYTEIPKYVKKYKAEGGIWPQYLWSSLNNMSSKDLIKIKNQLKFAIVGGERCDIKEAEKFFEKTGVTQMTGYGASEVNTTFSITHPNCNKVGTAGIPLPFNNVKIVNESFEDVTYGQRGKLFISSPCLMLKYYNRHDLTEKAIYTDKKGTRWYNTGDYAVIDNDGCLTVIDRYMEPVIIRSNNKEHKVNLLDMIEDIRFDKNIKYCKATFSNGKIIIHLSLEPSIDKEKQEMIGEIIETIKSKVPEENLPDFICIYDNLPRTSVGKIDYKLLNEKSEEIGKEENINKLQVIDMTEKEKVKTK